MNDLPSNPAWLDEETARRYKIFTDKTPMYQELSAVMVELAQLEPGMRVLDLGCGTGVTTQALLQALGEHGHVVALDLSPAMLKLAREQIDTPQVTFLQGDAAEAAGLLQEPVDRIVCNSLFWQFRHKPQVMAALHQLLAPGGLFVFNIPEPYFIFQHIPRSPKVSLLFKQLAAERYGVGQQDLRTIELFLNHHHFELLKTQEFVRTRSAEESYLFFQLPVATAWMDPPLDYPTRLALLEEARQMTNLLTPPRGEGGRSGETGGDHFGDVRQRWMYFVARSVIGEA